MGLLHRTQMYCDTGPPVSSATDNYSLVKVQGTAGQIHLSSIFFHMIFSDKNLFIIFINNNHFIIFINNNYCLIIIIISFFLLPHSTEWEIS